MAVLYASLLDRLSQPLFWEEKYLLFLEKIFLRLEKSSISCSFFMLHYN